MLRAVVFLLIFVADTGLALADAASPTRGPAIGQGAFVTQTLLYLVVGFLCFYFLITRPAIQKEQTQKNLLANLKKNDEVMTQGGILGRVHSVGSEFVTLEIASGVRVRVHPEYLREVVEEKKGPSAGDDSPTKDKPIPNSKESKARWLR